MDKPVVRISVRNLVEFILRSGDLDNRGGSSDREAMQKGSRLHRKIQGRMGSHYRAEVSLKYKTEYEDVSIQVEGRADGIFTEDGQCWIDEIKGVYADVSQLEKPVEVHRAQAMCYAWIYAQEQKPEKIGVQMTYGNLDTEELKFFREEYTLEELRLWYQELLDRYHKWIAYQIAWKKERNVSMSDLEFPFEYREGQRKIVSGVYHTISTERQIFIQAPTGVGKTMSTIFPAVRAVGAGLGENIFYLTAKTITRTVAEEAFSILKAHGLKFKVITITAKEKLCFCEKAECNPQHCEWAKGHFDRINDAIFELMTTKEHYSREEIEACAQKYKVCPFELGLDLSEWCDVVIGDYNYLFDPVVRLRRFFDASGDWLFLIDEAHNLPDRARAMYSASFSKASLTEAKRSLGPGKSALKTALRKADKAFLEARRAVAELAPRHGTLPAEAAPAEAKQTSLLDAPEAETAFALPEPLFAEDGTVFFRELPAGLLKPLQALTAPLQDWLEQHPDAEAHTTLLDLYFKVQDILRAAERYDEHFTAQLTAYGSALDLHILCLDPAPFVDASLSGGRAAALFSATLTPPGYYRNVLGCPDARAVALESPFPPQHLGLYCLPSISTRYRDREASIRPLSDALAAMAKGKVGNYLAFFPSYAYLRQVYEDFTARYPDIPTLAQESGLDDAGRAAFLARFAPHPEKTLLGFGVLGGIFGEGVDLAGDRLIGCAIVGVGLPQVNPRQEMLRRYYDAAPGGTGFDYAYRCPGMNKVLQAAGRVIRTSEDKGVVLLLDDRFARSEYTRLFPRHWGHLQYLQSTQALSEALDAFWKQP